MAKKAMIKTLGKPASMKKAGEKPAVTTPAAKSLVEKIKREKK